MSVIATTDRRGRVTLVRSLGRSATYNVTIESLVLSEPGGTCGLPQVATLTTTDGEVFISRRGRANYIDGRAGERVSITTRGDVLLAVESPI
jgi:hypothetical protein